MRKLVLGLAVIAAFASCKKSDTPANNCTASTSTIAGTYKISAIKYKADAASTEQDLFSNLPDCQKDDTYQLNADGTVVFADAGVSCGLPPSPGLPTNWTLESNNTIIKMAEFSLKISSFDCTTLVVTESDTFAAGDTKTTTYVKQ